MTAAASAGSYFLAIEPYRARGSVIGWVGASLAVAFAVRTLLVVFFDRPAYVFPDPLPFGIWHVGGATIQQRSLVVAAVAFALAALGAALLRRTRFGRALEAIAQDFDAAVLVGLPGDDAWSASRSRWRVPGPASPRSSPRRPAPSTSTRPPASASTASSRPSSSGSSLGGHSPPASASAWSRRAIASAHWSSASGVPRRRSRSRPASSCWPGARARLPRSWSDDAPSACPRRFAIRARRGDRAQTLRRQRFALAAFAPLVVGDSRIADLAGGLYLAVRRRRARVHGRGRPGCRCSPREPSWRSARSSPSHLGSTAAVRSSVRSQERGCGLAVGAAFARLPRAGFAAATWIVTWLVAIALESLGWRARRRPGPRGHGRAVARAAL